MQDKYCGTIQKHKTPNFTFSFPTAWKASPQEGNLLSPLPHSWLAFGSKYSRQLHNTPFVSSPLSYHSISSHFSEKPVFACRNDFNLLNVKCNNCTNRMHHYYTVIEYFKDSVFESRHCLSPIILSEQKSYHPSPWVHFSRSVASDSLWPHGLQHARLPCPSRGAYSNSCALSQWCHPTISSSVIPFSSCFNLSQHQDIFQWVSSLHQVAKVLEFSVSASVLPMNIQDWFALGWIFLQSKGLSRVFSNTTVQKHQFFFTQLSLWSKSQHP